MTLQALSLYEQGWHVVAASVQGTSHQRANKPCQDSHAVQIMADGTLILAVSDGAGSAEHSHVGSQECIVHAVQTIFEELSTAVPTTDADWSRLFKHAFEAALGRLVNVSEEASVPLRDLAATLTCAVVSPTCLAAAQVGDGTVVAGLSDGTLVLVLEPQTGEYANQTFFLTSASLWERFAVSVLAEEVRMLALTTDGLLKLATKLPNYIPSPRFFGPVFRFTANGDDSRDKGEELATYLASKAVCDRTDDDKTLILAVRPPTVDLIMPAMAHQSEAPVDSAPEASGSLP